MKHKVLLICNYFAPDHTIGAVRTSKLAKYLRNCGYEVEVLTEKKKGEEDELLKNDIKGIPIYYTENSKRFIWLYAHYEKFIQPYKKKRFDKLDNRKRVNRKTGNIEFYPFETAYPIIGSLDYVFGQLKQIDLFRNAKRLLRKKQKFDFIITSYGDSFAYFAGKYYCKHHKDTTWIFDIRDSIYRYKFIPDYVSLIPKRYEQYIWKHADCITGVSKGICKRVSPKFRHKVCYLTNGFDQIDRKGLKRNRMDTHKMIFTYTGSMYGGLCDLSVFFNVMKDLILNEQIDEKRIEFHFAGNESAFQIFKNQAAQYQLAEQCISHGKLSRHDAMELQQRSDMLLVASYDYQNCKGGVITGKALEYMGARRPVIAVITGDIKHSELADIVRKTNIGIAYEDTHRSKDYVILYDYVRLQYQKFLETNETEYKPNETEICKYDYENLTKRLVKIMIQAERRHGKR